MTPESVLPVPLYWALWAAKCTGLGHPIQKRNAFHMHLKCTLANENAPEMHLSSVWDWMVVE